MKRKILSLILVFAMTVSLFTVGTGAVEPTYGDTAGHWAESSIERWSAYGIIQGSNGQFDPNGQLTCAQLATILAKLLKLPAAKDAGFTDNTADAWYYDAINRCAAAGILNGNGDGTVTPEAPISRERAMVMLARALGIEPIRKPDLTKYTDAAQVSAYAQGYVAALIEAGIVGGVTADELAPQDNINRASTVTILDRAIGTYADKAGATIKADGKGLVLVVAENVKITGAPEGTKIVVADGATGLTVNGKSVSDDQTYIVPKTTTSSGSSSSGGHSHTHSYNETTHKCSCGAFAPAVVATIGNTNGYLTLKEAVAAATNGAVVKLLEDVAGQVAIPAGKKLTLDLNGKTITHSGTAIINNGTLIVKNGAVVSTGNCGIGIGSNSETTILSDVTVTAQESAVITSKSTGAEIYIEGGTFTSKDNAVIAGNGSARTGDPNKILIKGGTFNGGITSDGYVACGIYAPWKDEITVDGGTFNITGGAGIVARAGQVSVNGGTFHCTDNATGKVGDSSEAVPCAALVFDSKANYPALTNESVILVKNGTFTVESGVAVAHAVKAEGDLNPRISIKGGSFSGNPSAYVAEGYIAYQKDDGTYQVVKNAGTVNVSLSELNKIAITKGPKATGEKTSFTVDLGSERVAASDIAYSENNSGYTGKGVQIGSRSLNNYAAKPAKVGDYEFVIKGGTITSAATGYSSIDSYKDTSVYMLVPGNSNVTFEDVTFEGVLSFDIQKYTSPWSNLNSLTFKNCIFKGIIIGTCPASNVTFDGCKFENYTNSTKPNNSNPIWWREDTEGSGANANPIKTFTFVNNEVVGTRPLKIERIGKTISPTFTFKNNTFDISKQDGDTETKNMAINIGMGENPNLPFTLIDEGNTISANTAALYTASLTGGSNWYTEVSGMKVLDGNRDAKIITAMVWKTTTGETFELKSVD